MLRRAEQLGLLVVVLTVGGRWKTNHYELRFPGGAKRNGGSGFEVKETRNDRSPNREPRAQQPGTAVPPNNKLNNQPNNRGRGARSLASALPAGARASARPSRQLGGDRGTQERAIAERLGINGWDILHWLIPAEVDLLGARQRTGSLSDRAIDELRLRYAEAQSGRAQ